MALIATSILLKHYDKTDRSIAKAKLIEHAMQVVTSMTRDRVDDHQNLRFGSFQEDGRTTPTATRIEGILAIFNSLADLPKFEQQKIQAALFASHICDITNLNVFKLFVLFSSSTKRN
jgi:hypothetical protein